MSSELLSLQKNLRIKIVYLYSGIGDHTQCLRHVSVWSDPPLYFSSELQVYLCFQIVLPLSSLEYNTNKNMFDKLNRNASFKKEKNNHDRCPAGKLGNVASIWRAYLNLSSSALINTWRGSMTHCHSSSGYNHDSFLSRWLWINLLQARNYASESGSAYYYFCLFASIVDGDLGVWAAWVAHVARLL